MTGNDARDIRAEAGLTRRDFAELVGAHPASVYRWEAFGRAITPMDPAYERFYLRLAQVMRRKKGRGKVRWLRTLQELTKLNGGLTGQAWVLYDLLPTDVLP